MHSDVYIYSTNPQDSANGKWDYGLLNEIFERNHLKQEVVQEIPGSDRGIVVIPGQGNAGKEKEISTQLLKIKRAILFITGDESAYFDVDRITHPNIEIWVQYPHKKHKKYNKFFVGAPKHIKEYRPEYPVKDYDTYFAGQITHQRRHELSQVMPKLVNSLYRPTGGFIQGDPPEKYYELMSRARIAPCPAGAVVIDSFRFFEAIELLCLPIADLKNSSGVEVDFFTYVSEVSHPVIGVKDWNTLEKLIPELLSDYPNNMHRVVCWWIKYKRDISIKIMRQLNE